MLSLAPAVRIVHVLCFKRFGLANLPSYRIAEWLAGPRGASLLREESHYLGEAARRFHGDTLLWVGCHEFSSRTVRGCMVRHQLFASELAEQVPGELASMRCELEALPLRNNSLDAMVLHHALEVSGDARGGLREAARVLAPGGRLVVCAFNPVSLLGMRRVYAQVRDDSFSGLRFITPLRLLDWLALLGFEMQGSVRYLAFGAPFSGDGREEAGPGRVERTLKRLQPPVGGVYLISAVKQAAAMRPHWGPPGMNSPRLVPAAYPKSAVHRTRAPVLKLSDWKDLERSR